MPVEFLSDEEAASYGRYVGVPTQAELAKVFFFDDDDRALIDRKDDEDELVARFGASFKNEWGWAAPLFKEPSFSLLENLAGLGHLHGFHRWASHGVHAGSKGTALNVVHRGPHGFKLAGPTNHGLADPGRGALRSLQQVTVAYLFDGRPDTGDPDDLVAAEAVQILVDEAGVSLLAAHAQLEKDEAAIWGSGE